LSFQKYIKIVHDCTPDKVILEQWLNFLLRCVREVQVHKLKIRVVLHTSMLSASLYFYSPITGQKELLPEFSVTKDEITQKARFS
jgi:hypothetical protein